MVSRELKTKGSPELDQKLQDQYIKLRRVELKQENPKLSVQQQANQILKEWEQFTWDQKEMFMDYLRDQCPDVETNATDEYDQSVDENNSDKKECSNQQQIVDEIMKEQNHQNDESDLINDENCENNDKDHQNSNQTQQNIQQITSTNRDSQNQILKQPNKSNDQTQNYYKNQNQFTDSKKAAYYKNKYLNRYNNANFEQQLSEDLFVKPNKQIMNERQHLKMKTADIMKRVEQKEYYKEINKKERLVSPYHRFAKKTMPELKLQDPGKEFYQYMSVIAKKWSEMTKEQKLEYDDKETQLKAKQFQNHKTQDQIFEELKQKEETYQLNMHYQKEQESVTVDGFVLYAEEQRKKIKQQNPKIKINELMEQIKSQWEGMNDQEKRQYNYTADRFKQSIRNKKS